MNENVKKALELLSVPRICEILTELCQRDSESPPGNEQATGEYIETFLNGLGIAAKREFVCKSDDGSKDRFNVMARIEGQDNSLLPYLYVGHIDVVPAGNPSAWETPAFEPVIRDGKIYGRGSCDMKGSIACMLHLLECWQKAGVVPKRPLELLFDVDEEYRNRGMRKYLETERKIYFGVVGEPTAHKIDLGHRGIMFIETSFKGRSAHASRPWLGVNAIEQATLFMNRVKEFSKVLAEREDPMLGPASLTTTVIRGGTKTNIIPESCVVETDRRLTVGETTEAAMDEIRAMIADIPGASTKLNAHLPVGWIPEDHPEIDHLKNVFRAVNGAEAEVSVFTATCEAGMLSAQTGAPSVIFGPGDIAQAHQDNEFCSLESLEKAARVFFTFFAE